MKRIVRLCCAPGARPKGRAGEIARKRAFDAAAARTVSEAVPVFRIVSALSVALGEADVAAHFLKHADTALEHADWLVQRTRELGGSPVLNPLEARAWTAEGQESKARIVDLLREDLQSELASIRSYDVLLDAIGTEDETTRQVLLRILDDEKKNVDVLRSLLSKLEEADAKSVGDPNARDGEIAMSSETTGDD